MYDYSFKIKDFSKSYMNHAKKVNMFVNSGAGYPVNLSPDQDNVKQYADKILSDEYIRLKQAAKKPRLRSFKAIINYWFIDVIAKWLAEKKLPSSWLTAVYLSRYAKFNQLMACVAQEVHNRLIIKPADPDALEVYIMTDQPENCVKCGCRTEFIEIDDLKQQHRCSGCGYEYFVDSE